MALKGGEGGGGGRSSPRDGSDVGAMAYRCLHHDSSLWAQDMVDGGGAGHGEGGGDGRGGRRVAANTMLRRWWRRKMSMLLLLRLLVRNNTRQCPFGFPLHNNTVHHRSHKYLRNWPELPLRHRPLPLPVANELRH